MLELFKEALGERQLLHFHFFKPTPPALGKPCVLILLRVQGLLQVLAKLRPITHLLSFSSGRQHIIQVLQIFQASLP